MVLAESVRKRSQCVDRKYRIISEIPHLRAHHIYFLLLLTINVPLLFFALHFPLNPQHRETTGTENYSLCLSFFWYISILTIAILNTTDDVFVLFCFLIFGQYLFPLFPSFLSNTKGRKSSKHSKIPAKPWIISWYVICKQHILLVYLCCVTIHLYVMFVLSIHA